MMGNQVGGASDSFSAFITLVDALKDPNKVVEAIAQIREATAAQDKAADAAKALIDQAHQEKLEADVLASEANDLMNQARAKESDALRAIAEASRKSEAVGQYEKEVNQKSAALQEGDALRAKSLSDREEKLQADTARRLEELAARELAVSNAEALINKRISEANSLEKEWRTKRDLLVAQTQAIAGA